MKNACTNHEQAFKMVKSTYFPRCKIQQINAMTKSSKNAIGIMTLFNSLFNSFPAEPDRVCPDMMGPIPCPISELNLDFSLVIIVSNVPPGIFSGAAPLVVGISTWMSVSRLASLFFG